MKLTGSDEQAPYLHQLLDRCDIIVMTPQILVNHLKAGTITNICVFSLLVFDECHHTQKGEPYNSIMKRYLQLKCEGKEERPFPQVLDYYRD